jgi:hypothetical protein
MLQQMLGWNTREKARKTVAPTLKKQVQDPVINPARDSYFSTPTRFEACYPAQNPRLKKQV